MRIWIDLANSPHPLLFWPIARELERHGHEVSLSARDHAQTVELAAARWPDVAVVGGESPSGMRKAATIAQRVRALRRWAAERDFEVALSHNSYGQILAARTLGVPAVTAMDYEHQPLNHVAFRAAQTVLLPEAYPADAARRQGARAEKTVRYPGLKESIYLREFEPDGDILRRIGVELEPGQALVVARTPPTRAVYHRLDNLLFVECLRTVDAAGAATVVLARHAEQGHELRRLGLRRSFMPEEAIDSRSLVDRADLFLGAGGTMTREAALLGVPTVTVFAGAVPAVDSWLEARGMIRRVTRAEELLPLRPRDRDPEHGDGQARGDLTLARFVAAVEAAGRSAA